MKNIYVIDNQGNTGAFTLPDNSHNELLRRKIINIRVNMLFQGANDTDGEAVLGELIPGSVHFLQ